MTMILIVILIFGFLYFATGIIAHTIYIIKNIEEYLEDKYEEEDEEINTKKILKG